MNEKKNNSKSTSRSQSQDTAAGAGLTMTNAKHGGKPRVQLGAIHRTSSGAATGASVGAIVMRRAMSNKEGKKEDRKPRFNIGLNSDEGTNSKSPASRNGDVGHVIEEEVDGGTCHPLPPSSPKPQLRSPKQ
jgi:hypothetical protein